MLGATTRVSISSGAAKGARVRAEGSQCETCGKCGSWGAALCLDDDLEIRWAEGDKGTEDDE
jgi:hypothetical protein